ncbi:MAG: copper-translocating P-type ATPase [Candidatus Yanofskybacteria bacterium RIFCSPHIGHO2_02_FULL_38_22b]|uniref:Copper-translocating P-type ATPase n=1 Tax=Candidatus Yanofskybacteria bacterium RIFCSPHIGHO2_02_FULL_38_22b TaxID=1802673 RepID=A0A1F8F2T6_9BACT|nr:MAG: copper-translocating P-type ATPase [Candidatus Yanofskybacteria bacterium RIFCSPHIGHO2_02_FULL_38_22b]OGN20432.1 MAG: copper-translocating P-type ATPase [Candidatus Yanofskybacteria bacterium RIFCSPLOWO2_01_FULL_39_28]
MDLILKKPGTNGQNHKNHTKAKATHEHQAEMTNPAMAKKMEADMRRRFLISFLLSIPIFLYSSVGINFFGFNLPTPIPVNWFLLILTTPIVFWTGSIFITGTYYSLKARKLNMSVLIATGVLAAYLFSVLLTFIRPESETFYEAAALLVTFVLFGHWMEMKSRRGTSDALRALFDLVPPKANVIRNGKEISIPSAEIIHDDIVLLRPGDKVPVDGEIIDGESSIDESLVTGESIPVLKIIGAKVVGGSVNQTGTIRFKATQVGSETVLAQIIKMVETAQNSKAPGQRIADKAAAYLVVLAIGSGLAAFFGWYFIGSVGLLTALTFAVSTVVIACPDALGLATPTAVAVGTGLGAKHNILIKDAVTLENTSRLNAIVLDKTGTLTEGKPKVTGVVAFNGFTERDILNYEASVEAGSNHPLAKAIMEEAERQGAIPLELISKFESIAGHGLKAVINGKTVFAGKEKLLLDNKVDVGSAREVLDRLSSEGKTLSLIAVDGKLAGVVAAADTIKPTAKKTITGLKQLGIKVAMITGDHKGVAEAVGKELGIDRIFAEVLPGDKAKYVKKLQDEGKFVGMVGDGINDAPALAQADIGIAIGAGTDVAIETGNIVLMKSDPYDIVAAIRLSKATVVKMKQNLFWAAIYNVLAIPIAAGVFYNSLGWSLRPEISALLMSASSIIVATNAVLLKRVEPKLKI